MFNLLKDKNLKSHELLEQWCDDDTKAAEKENTNLDLSLTLKPNDMSKALRKLTLNTSSGPNKTDGENNGVACIPVHQEPKFIYKPEPLIDSVPRLRIKSDQSKIEVLNENNSSSQMAAPTSPKKVYYTNQINRNGSPLTTSFSSVKDDKNSMESNYTTRPLSSNQVKKEQYPMLQVPKSSDTECLSTESVYSKRNSGKNSDNIN